MNRKPYDADEPMDEPTNEPMDEMVEDTDRSTSTPFAPDATSSRTTPITVSVTASEGSTARDARRGSDSLAIYRVIDERDAASPFDTDGSDKGGRWTSPGTPALYASFSAATALLEFIAHLEENSCPRDLMIAIAQIAPSVIETPSVLPAEWNERPYRSQVRLIGDEWLQSGRSIALRVPSVLCPGEFNVILNPRHPQFSAQLKLAHLLPLDLDYRLRF